MRLKKLTLLILLASSTVALGLDGVEKSNAKLSFHNKIDTSSSSKAKLESQMKALYERSAQAHTVKTEEEQMVSDFIDVEVHWGGKSEKVVDRRMNSVSEPQVVSVKDF